MAGVPSSSIFLNDSAKEMADSSENIHIDHIYHIKSKNHKRVMNVQQVKDEIRKLSRTDKIEIYRWIDEEAVTDLLLRIGVPKNPVEANTNYPTNCLHPSVSI